MVNAHAGWLTRLLLVLATAVLVSPQPLSAAVIVDPDGVGATDVDPADPTTWTSSTYAYVGKTASGALRVDDESQVNSKCGFIGYNEGSTGNVTVDGPGSTWTNSSELYVGRYGSGTLEITNGGAVSSSSTDSFIGRFSGSTGTVTVDGIGSAWTSDKILHVGDFGSGILEITNGGMVSSSGSVITSDSTSIVTVDGTDSTWTISGSLLLGRNGTLEITDGGGASDSSAYIGVDAGSVSTVIVDGTDSTWTNSSILYVGHYGNGTLTIANGGAVSNTACIIGYYGSTGTVTVDGIGSTWTNADDLSSGNGTLKITNGGRVSNASASIGGGVTFTAIVTGIGSTWTNASDLRVGLSSGTLEITWDGLVSVAGILTIDQNGLGDSFINMAAGGMLALHGDADDSLAAFLDLINGTDAIRYWNESTSSWSAITGAVFGEDYTLSYVTEGDLAGYTVLTVLTTTVPADANWDGLVNELDAAVLASHWGETGGWSDGDFNHDGIINALDASILAANWGHGTGESTAVPEPSMFVMLVGLAGLLCGRRHR